MESKINKRKYEKTCNIYKISPYRQASIFCNVENYLRKRSEMSIEALNCGDVNQLECTLKIKKIFFFLVTIILVDFNSINLWAYCRMIFCQYNLFVDFVVVILVKLIFLYRFYLPHIQRRFRLLL